MKTGVYYHPDFADKGYTTLQHRVKPGFDALQGLIRAGKIEVLTPVINQQAEELLQQTHHNEHIARVKTTPYHEVALLSAAGVIQAAEKLSQGELEFAFCFVGSAGHHAGYNYTWGFCYYNDVAMAVKRLQVLGIEKIMIIDVDPHSGDGTRDILANETSIIHINFHADEEYNYADHKRQNYSIFIDGADDRTFLAAVDEYLEQDWDYEFLIVIFGHDGHGQDYGDFYLSTRGYQEFAKKIKTFATRKPILFVLSGGSSPQVAAEVIPAVIEVFAND
ncbi:MAG: hypothetical protein PHD40_03125 [Syntrophomonadaceae bacterium]|nr:hypothetical protein [Syntrophomonadaceae bacterium]